MQTLYLTIFEYNLNEQKQDEMTMIKKLLISLLIFTSCSLKKEPYFVKTENVNEIIDNKQVIVSQKIQTCRVSDSLPICVLTKVSNYNNDLRIETMTGLRKEDGLQDYLQDSIFYYNKGNDTLKKSYVSIHKHWQFTQIFRKRFRSDNQVEFYMTERPFDNEEYYKKEIYYQYNTTGQILSQTEFECIGTASCDSILKKEYIYSAGNKLEKEIFYYRKGNNWEKFKEKLPGVTVY